MHNLVKYLNQMVKQHHSTLCALLKSVLKVPLVALHFEIIEAKSSNTDSSGAKFLKDKEMI